MGIVMMSCKHVDDFLDDYLAGRLSLATSIKFKAHLALCSACRRYLEDYRRTVTAAQATGKQEPPSTPIPPELAESIAKLMAENPRSSE